MAQKHYMIFVPFVEQAIGCTTGVLGLADAMRENPNATFRETTPHDCAHALVTPETTEADRNARFVEKVREIICEDGHPSPRYPVLKIRMAHREIYNAPCKPVEPVKE